MIKRNSILLLLSLLISVGYLVIYALTKQSLEMGLVSKLVSLVVSVITFCVYFRLGSFLNKYEIKKNSAINSVLSISSLIIVSLIVWIYSYTRPYYDPGVSGIEWLPYYFINAPFLAINDLISNFVPFLYFVYPYITTFIIFMGLRYGKKKSELPDEVIS